MCEPLDIRTCNAAHGARAGEVRTVLACALALLSGTWAGCADLQSRAGEAAGPVPSEEREGPPCPDPSQLADGWACAPATGPDGFTMGRESESESPRWEPLRTVVLTRPFLIGTHEVTVGEWEAVMGDEPPLLAAAPTQPCDSVSYADCDGECPVPVGWYEALQYCNGLSRLEGFEECYRMEDCQRSNGELLCAVVAWDAGLDCAGYRLPTEAEWEWAARAGTSTDYFFGDMADDEVVSHPMLDSAAWYAENSAGEDCQSVSYRHHAVGGKLPNPWGLHDVYGSATEWVWDWFRRDPRELPQSDPISQRWWDDNGFEAQHVARGGAIDAPAESCRSASRTTLGQTRSRLIAGIRFVRTIGRDAAADTSGATR